MMNHTIPRSRARQGRAAATLALLLALSLDAPAGPGAHGPNGEHLDAPTTAPAPSARPRLESQTEGFELVAELRAAELVIVVDRFETNEPVLGARLEVESGGLKAVAAFRPEQGDYAVTDTALLQALAAPGEHGMVFTLVAGAESDLLDGTLVTAAGGGTAAQADHGHSHAHGPGRAAWIGGGLAALGLLGAIAWWRRQRTSPGAMTGAS